MNPFVVVRHLPRILRQRKRIQQLFPALAKDITQVIMEQAVHGNIIGAVRDEIAAQTGADQPGDIPVFV